MWIQHPYHLRITHFIEKHEMMVRQDHDVDDADDCATSKTSYGSCEGSAIDLEGSSAVLAVARGDGICRKETVDDHSNYCDYYLCCTWKEYFCSWRFAELLACVLPFLSLGVYFEITDLRPRMRPIPIQKIFTTTGNAAGEEMFAWNPVNAEISMGNTISHRQYQVFMGLFPWLLQLILAWFVIPVGRRQARFFRWDTIHRTTCAYFVGIGLTDVVTNCVKYYVSRLLLALL